MAMTMTYDWFFCTGLINHGPIFETKDNGKPTFLVLGSGVAAGRYPKTGLLVSSTSRGSRKDGLGGMRGFLIEEWRRRREGVSCAVKCRANRRLGSVRVYP